MTHCIPTILVSELLRKTSVTGRHPLSNRVLELLGKSSVTGRHPLSNTHVSSLCIQYLQVTGI